MQNITVLQNSPNGPVEFNITAYDGAGNEFNVTQNDTSTNVIIDTVNPTLSNLTIYSNNSRTDYAMAGHLLNITITANEALKAANITVFGITHMMIVTGTTASANVTVNETSPEGDVLFNITAFDLAGNNLTVTQTNLNSSNLTIDRTNPTLSNLTIYSNNTHDTSLATLGDALNITITANENLSSAEIMLLNSTYAMNITGQIANASVIVNASHADGQVEFNITTFDLAGNSLTVTQTNLNSSNLTIDRTNPTLSNLTIYSNNPHNTSLATLGDTLNITITANENLSSAEIMLLNSTYAMNITGQIANASVIVNASHADGQVEFNITTFDLAGNNMTVNQTNLNSSNLTIDKNIPGVTNLGLYSNNSNSSLARAGDLINITLEVSEQIYNATLQILNTTINMTESNNTAYANITVLQNSTNGPVAFNITAYDGSGNEFNVTQNDTSANVIIDTVDPKSSNLTIYSNNPHNTSLATLGNTLNITITSNENLSSAEITLLNSTYAMNITGQIAYASMMINASHADGQVKFNITAFDLAGNNLTVNQTNLNSSNLTIDKNVPGVINLGLYSNNSDPSLARAGDLINITIELSEQIYDATLQILNTTINMTESINTAYANITVLQNSTNGLVEFNITAYDGAGNQFNVTQTTASANVIIDTVDPKSSNLTIFSNNSRTDYAMGGHLLNITITADETLKNANITILNSTYVMSVNGTVANASVNVYENSTEGEVLFNITAFDLAGNNLTVTRANLTSSNLTIDNTDPTLSNLTIYSDNHNTSLATLGNTLNITITTNEDLSSANITILGATYTMSTSGMVANASVTVNASHADGKVEFSITALDLAGNSLAVNQTNLNSSNLTIDKNVPSVTNLTLYSNNSNSSLAKAGDLINITLEVSEQIYNATLQILGTEMDMTESNNTAYANITVLENSQNGHVAFNITAYDAAGNEFNLTQNNASANVIIDTVNPESSNLTIYSNNPHNTSLATLGNTLNITITANENLSSAEIMLLNDTYEMNITGQIAYASMMINASHADGKVEFNITAFDLAGNSLTVTQANLNSSNLTIDKNVPGVVNLGLYSNNSDPSLARAGDLINITIELSEQIYNATLQILGTEIDMTESNNSAYANITVLQNSPNGPVEFNITAYDGAGNEFNVTQNDTSTNVIIDTVNPTLSNLTIYSDNHNTSLATLGKHHDYYKRKSL